MSGGGSGGGGGSGKVSWPSYYEMGHKYLLGSKSTDAATEYDSLLGPADPSDPSRISLIRDIANTHDDSPFSTLVAYDPTTEIAVAQDRFDDYDSHVTALAADPLPTNVTSGVTAVDDTLLPPEKAYDLVDDFAILVGAVDPTTDWNTFSAAMRTEFDTNTLKDADGVTLMTAERAVLSALNGATNIATLMTAAAASVDANIESDDEVSASVAAFDESQGNLFARAMNRMAAGFRDINAVCSSAFVQGIAWLEFQRSRESANYESNLRMQLKGERGRNILATADMMRQADLNKLQLTQSSLGISVQLALDRARLLTAAIDSVKTNKQFLLEKQVSALGLYLQVAFMRAQMIVGYASELSRLTYAHVDAEKVSSAMQTELSRLKMIADKEYVEREAEYAIKDSLWNLELWHYAGNFMSAAQGGIGPTTLGTNINPMTTALAGASAGAMAGASIPGAGGWGAVVGAVIGGAAGYYAGS